MIVFAAFVALIASVAAQQPSTRARSPNSTTAIRLNVRNTCGNAVKLVWLDHNGREVVYETLNVDQEITRPTYEGHLWRIRDASDNLELSHFTAHADARVEACPEGHARRRSGVVATPRPANSNAVCSGNSQEVVNLNVVNNCRERIFLEWIAFDCHTQRFAELAPGQTNTQRTFATHQWQAVNASSGAVVGRISVDAQHSNFVVSCGAR